MAEITKRRLYVRVLLISGTSIAALVGFAAGRGIDDRWGKFALAIAAASAVSLVLTLIHVASTPDDAMRNAQRQRQPIGWKKQTKLFAAIVGAWVIIAGIMIPAARLFGLTHNWVILPVAGLVACIASMTLVAGVGAKFGLLRFKPAKWVRRLFNIPDDYQPPAR